MLNNVIRKEIDIGKWKDKPELVERVLVHLNNLHRDALQKALSYESQIKEAGGEPDVVVEITWPESPPMPDPIEEDLP